MKRIFFCTLCAIALIMVTACGRSGQAATGFSPEDLYLRINETRYHLNVNIEAVIADLGSDYEYAEGKSCDYDGLDKTFLYEVAEFYTWPMPEGDLVNEIYTQSPSVTTSKGIAAGAAKEDVLAAYGEAEDTGYQLIYRAEEGSLCFDLENDVVTAVSVTRQPV